MHADSNPEMLSCQELKDERPHILCNSTDGTLFLARQCNLGVCRCVNPISGDLVGSGIFFDEEDLFIDCIEGEKVVGTHYLRSYCMCIYFVNKCVYVSLEL